jgi:5-methylthioadenosine/S-adenosylhomocysteine deaminase
MQRFRAAWVLPVDLPPIQDGAVLLDDAGRIAAVDREALVPRPEHATDTDLGGATLLPGLVNTHTHLELTGLAGTVHAGEFLEWIRQVIAVKAGRSQEQFLEAAARGIREMWAAGVTTISDTGSTGAVIEAMAALGAAGDAHHEVFGAHPDQAAAAMRPFSRALDRLAAHATGRITLGLAPHAPYTVSGALYAASAGLARAHGAPMAVHIAEPAGEMALLRDFTGPFADDWQRQGIPRPSPDPITPLEFLERHEVLSPRTLCVHVIGATPADAVLMARHGVAVAHCPRSNRTHHHADAPLALLHRHGLRVGLGTDSEISVAPPDLLAEARAARALGGWSAEQTLRALTLGGAEALGRDGNSGALRVGHWGDMVAIRPQPLDDPIEAVLAATRADVAATWLGGRLVHGTPPAAWA